MNTYVLYVPSNTVVYTQIHSWYFLMFFFPFFPYSSLLHRFDMYFIACSSPSSVRTIEKIAHKFCFLADYSFLPGLHTHISCSICSILCFFFYRYLWTSCEADHALLRICVMAKCPKCDQSFHIQNMKFSNLECDNPQLPMTEGKWRTRIFITRCYCY